MPKRRRAEVENATARRSTNACHRCKNKKMKCYFNEGSFQSTCVACIKSGSNCVFDVTPDGIPRGAEYIATLESRIASLEGQLREATQGPAITEAVDLTNHRAAGSGSGHPTTEAGSNGFSTLGPQTTRGPSATRQKPPTGEAQTRHKVIESASDGVTVFNFLSNPPMTPESEGGSLPGLPAENLANELLETTYLYTQSRYCLVDWVQVRQWHGLRESFCGTTNAQNQEAETAAYFIWMIYAIGAQLTPNHPQSPEGYYTRALKHLPVILSQQNLTAVQALLVLIQYFYRSPGGPSIWHLAGAAMRLCVELGLHRKAIKITGIATADPYTTELRKRLFWSAYCFDRSVSILSKRPFGIHDTDIDVELPVDIDVICLDRDLLRDRQVMQAAGEQNSGETPVSTITASLHHLHMYRLQSRIMTRFAGTHAALLTSEEALSSLQELDEWRVRASTGYYPPSFPQQSYESVQAFYYMTALLLLRPTLARPTVDEDLLRRCATLSAEACENEKLWCFSPQNHNSPVRIYNCFRCGLTLLQCLAIRPTILPVRSALRAINCCSSALSVYTGSLAPARPYLRLFDKLSDHFFGYDDDGTLCHPNDTLRSLLHSVTSCDPSEIPELLKSLSTEETSRQIPGQTPTTNLVRNPPNGNVKNMANQLTAQQVDQEDVSRGMYTAPTLGMDLITPFEILEDSLRPDLFQEDMMSFWGGFSAW